jgi:hypothetical protein
MRETAVRYFLEVSAYLHRIRIADSVRQESLKALHDNVADFIRHADNVGGTNEISNCQTLS